MNGSRARLKFLWLLCLVTACSPAASPTPAPLSNETVSAPQITATAGPTPTLARATASPTPAATASTTAIVRPSPLPKPDCQSAFELLSPSEGRSITEGFGPQIENYLNFCGLTAAFEAALGRAAVTVEGETWPTTAQLRAVDVTGDKQEDAVIALSFSTGQPGAVTEGALFVFRQEAGVYLEGGTIAFNGQIVSAPEPSAGLRSINDLNNDRIAEIVLSYVETVDGDGNFARAVRVLAWDGQRFADRVRSVDDRARVSNGGVEIRKVNDQLALVLSNGVARGPTATPLERPRTEIWEWDGEAYSNTCTRYTGVAVYQAQAVWDGDNASGCGEYATARTAYQQAIFNKRLRGWVNERLTDPNAALDADERPRLEAYARYRLLLTYAATRNVSAAQKVIDALQEKFPPGAVGDLYAAMAARFWLSYQSEANLALACTAAVEYAAGNQAIVLAPLSGARYGNANREYELADVCPLK